MISTSSRGRTVILVAALAIAVASSFLASRALTTLGVDGPITNAIDFRAFYCASRVAAGGANPYLVEPLRTCETNALKSVRLVWNPGLAVPAPLPPYALAAFLALAALPFVTASQLWFSVLLLSLVLAVVLVQRLSGLRPLVVAASLVLALGVASLVNGQIVPIVLCSLCGGGLLLRAGKPTLAALVLSISAIEPHAALPSILAVFIWSKSSRFALAMVAAALSLASFILCGPRTVWQYFAAVLPAHARSELTNFSGQYSLSALLHRAGASDGVSLALGNLSYVAAVVLGLALARQLAQRFEDPAFYAITPVALIVLGGTFVHIHQMTLALPLALVLVSHARGRTSLALAAVVVALAIPGQTMAESHFVADRNPSSVRGTVAPPAAANGAELAEVSWTARVRAASSGDDARSGELLAIKAPTWLALFALALVGWRMSRQTRSNLRAPSAGSVRRFA